MAKTITDNGYKLISETGEDNVPVYRKVPEGSKNTRTQNLYDKLDTSGRSQTSLKFPADLGFEGHTGVIRFNISLPEGSKYGGGGANPVNDSSGNQVSSIRQSSANSVRRRFSGNSRPIDTVVDLFLPPQIQTTYGSDWAWQGLGVIGAGIEAADIVGGIQSSSDTANVIHNAGKAAYASMPNFISSIGDKVTGLNTNSALQTFTGSVKNPYMELLFEGINPRTFSFTFKMIPRNSDEQSTIHDIVKMFKFHQAPEIRQGASHYWKVPSEFDITFMYKGGENPWINKISTCALSSVSVDYSAEGHYAAHKDGSPFATTLTLEFQEMELLTKERIEEGY